MNMMSMMKMMIRWWDDEDSPPDCFALSTVFSAYLFHNHSAFVFLFFICGIFSADIHFPSVNPHERHTHKITHTHTHTYRHIYDLNIRKKTKIYCPNTLQSNGMRYEMRAKTNYIAFVVVVGQRRSLSFEPIVHRTPRRLHSHTHTGSITSQSTTQSRSLIDTKCS